MKNLFYFASEKCLCWVAGYSAQDHSANVSEMLESIQLDAKKFAEVAGVDLADVKSEYVTHRSRYKNMRIFHAVVENPPSSAFVFETMTMRGYISDTEPYHQPAVPEKTNSKTTRYPKVWVRGVN